MALMRFTKTADELEDAIDGVLQESADAAARAREHIARVFGTLEEEEALLDLEMEELDFELRYGRQRRRKAREASVGEGSADSNGAPLSPASGAAAGAAAGADALRAQLALAEKRASVGAEYRQLSESYKAKAERLEARLDSIPEPEPNPNRTRTEPEPNPNRTGT